MRAPKSRQRVAVRAVTQFFKGAIPDLSDPLTGYAQERADLFESSLFAVIQSVVKVEDLSLPLSEIAIEHCFEEFPASDGFHVLFNFGCLDASEPFTKSSAITVTAINRSI